MAGKRGGDQLAGKHFAEGCDVVSCARSEFTNRRDAAEQFLQIFEFSSEIAVELGEESCAQQLAGGVVVAFAKLASQRQRGLTVASAGCTRHVEQLVGDSGHRADYDDRSLRQALAHDGGDTFN